MTDLQNQIIELSYRNKLSHLSSTLSAAPIIEAIYGTKAKDDIFILSQGHAAVALYCVLGRGQELLDRWGPHPHRSIEDGIYCTTGSLGMGITVALGMAMTGKTVHCLISDGECGEGAVWEALRLASEFAPSLKVYLNFNGQSAYGKISETLVDRVLAFYPSTTVCYSEAVFPFAQGIDAHYHVITDAEYEAWKASR